jgi:hypothetical protein
VHFEVYNLVGFEVYDLVHFEVYNLVGFEVYDLVHFEVYNLVGFGVGVLPMLCVVRGRRRALRSSRRRSDGGL